MAYPSPQDERISQAIALMKQMAGAMITQDDANGLIRNAIRAHERYTPHGAADYGTTKPTFGEPEARRVSLEMIRQTIGALEFLSKEQVTNIAIEVVEKLANVTTRLEVIRHEQPTITIDNPHKMLRRLTYLASQGQHVYLYGPPGSGKSTGAYQAAKALGWNYAYISLNVQTSDSRVVGYLDANGIFREPSFAKAWREGNTLFCIDELDNGSANLLTSLNGCLANGVAAFPCGNVPKGKNFVVVGTGNTTARGANPMFPDRRPIDQATIDRFAFLTWDYDEGMERRAALAIERNASPWINWVSAARKYCKAQYPRIAVTPRATYYGAQFMRGSTFEELAEESVFKGLDAATKETILRAVPLPKGAF